MRRIGGRIGGFALVRVDLVEKLAGLLTRELDQSRHPQGLTDVVHIHDQDGDARQRQHERGDYRGSGYLSRLTRVSRFNLPDREQGVDERRDEQTDSELAGAVSEQPLNDARRELPHPQLDNDQHDRQYQRCQAHHRRGNRAEDAERGVRAADE